MNIDFSGGGKTKVTLSGTQVLVGALTCAVVGGGITKCADKSDAPETRPREAPPLGLGVLDSQAEQLLPVPGTKPNTVMVGRVGAVNALEAPLSPAEVVIKPAPSDTGLPSANGTMTEVPLTRYTWP